MRNNSLFVEFFQFIKVKKRYWLIPVLLLLFLVALLIIVGQSSTLSPFIYALF